MFASDTLWECVTNHTPLQLPLILVSVKVRIFHVEISFVCRFIYYIILYHMTHFTADHQATLTQAQKIQKNILKSISLYILLGIEKLSFMSTTHWTEYVYHTNHFLDDISGSRSNNHCGDFTHPTNSTNRMALDGDHSSTVNEKLILFYVTIAHSYVIMMLTFIQSWSHTWE